MLCAKFRSVQTVSHQPQWHDIEQIQVSTWICTAGAGVSNLERNMSRSAAVQLSTKSDSKRNEKLQMCLVSSLGTDPVRRHTIRCCREVLHRPPSVLDDEFSNYSAAHGMLVHKRQRHHTAQLCPTTRGMI